METQSKIIIAGGGIAGLIMGYELTKRGIKDYIILESCLNENDLLNRSHIYYIHNPIEDIKHLLVEKDMQTFAFWKGRFFNKTNPLMSNLYSQRITGKHLPTAINHINGIPKKGFFPESGDLQEIVKFYLSNQGGKIEYGAKISKIDPNKQVVLADGDYYRYELLINTIPMPMLLGMLHGVNNIGINSKFSYSPIYIYRGNAIETQDIYQEVYVPTSEDSVFYRMLVYNDTVIAESEEDLSEDGKLLFHSDIKNIFDLRMSRVVDHYKLSSGRFIPIKDRERKEIIGQLTDEFNIFSFGRYGTWSYKRTDHLPSDAEELIKLIGYKGIKL